MNKSQAQCIHGRVGVCFHCATDLSAHRQQERAQQQAHQQDSGAIRYYENGSPRQVEMAQQQAAQMLTPPSADEYKQFDAAVELQAVRSANYHLRSRNHDLEGERDRLRREKAELETDVAWLQREVVRLGGKKRGAR